MQQSCFMVRRIWTTTLALAVLAACDDVNLEPVDDAARAAREQAARVQCEPDNGGITLPAGFCASIVADNLGAARHMAITPRGDIFVAINQANNQPVPAFGIIALRDTDGDGDADITERFNAGKGGSGITWAEDRLYFGENDRVLRYQVPLGNLTPTGSADVVVGGLPSTGDHISKTLAWRDAQTLFVNIGSASNACQVQNRRLESPGVNPCPELPIRAGVWTFNPGSTNQTQANGQRYATGLRNMVALAVHPGTRELFGVQHGRDMLFENWPDMFTQAEDAVLPAEELIRIGNGSDNGWPYCYFDAVTGGRKVLAPEYGGDGTITSGSGFNCASMNQPLASFGAHWAPNGVTFYDGLQFPDRYRNGAFIAFHGGFDRAPLPNEGYNVMFVPMDASGRPTGQPELFADGFAGSTGPLPATAVHRPVGVTQGPDGSLYVSDDRGGRIWRIVYIGP
jgi:glucose/arabinose dehydrogenase